jgi:hypothetical protein
LKVELEESIQTDGRIKVGFEEISRMDGKTERRVDGC